MGSLFGTDGIRGVAGSPPLDADTIYGVGLVLTAHLKAESARPRILIARDTRESGPWIERLLRLAIADAGGCSEDCGVLSTPAVSYLTTRVGAQAGIMISASHNPYQDNGIKVFAANGMKFSDAVEEEIEREILARSPAPFRTPGTAGGELAGPGFEACRRLYTQHLVESLRRGFRLGGMRLVVDCAHGSLSALAPGFLSGLDADVHAIHCSPDGRNINHEAGSLHVEHLRSEVLARGADLGVAFDGDADRAIFVDRQGVIRDGDDVLYLLARHMDHGDAPRLVVGTVMANLGLEIALEEAGFRLIRTSVGDRYVLEEMLRAGAAIGGEQSGHIILIRLARTGDGLLTALKVLEVLCDRQKDIAELCLPMKRFPQVLCNVRVQEKIPLREIPGLAEAEEAWKKKLGRRSRILLRYSGTEKLARVMVEGEDEGLVSAAAEQLATFFSR